MREGWRLRRGGGRRPQQQPCMAVVEGVEILPVSRKFRSRTTAPGRDLPCSSRVSRKLKGMDPDIAVERLFSQGLGYEYKTVNPRTDTVEIGVVRILLEQASTRRRCPSHQHGLSPSTSTSPSRHCGALPPRVTESLGLLAHQMDPSPPATGPGIHA